MDEKGEKIQACIKRNLIQVFDGQLQEDDVVIISNFCVCENKARSKVVASDFKINFYRCTTVRHVDGWEGAEYGFKFIPFEDILKGEAKDRLTVDVAGSVIWYGTLDVFGRPPKQSKRLNFEIQNFEGVVLPCTMWNDYAEQVNNFIYKNTTNEHVMAVIQHGRIKYWKDQMTVQSDKFGTRLFLNIEIDEVNQLRRSLILKQGQQSASTSQRVCSKHTVYPLYQEFSVGSERKHVDELSEIDRPMSCVVVGTIKTVQESYGWFYTACRKCFKKVVTKSEYLQHAEEVYEDILKLSPTALICLKCQCECTSITTKFKVHVMVEDETGGVSFVMFDRDLLRIVGSAASNIRERQLKLNDNESLPHELSRLVDKKLAFKIDVSEYNLKHNCHVYTVQKICDDPDVLAQLVSENDNLDNNVDEVSQGDDEFRCVNLWESSHGGC